MKRVLLLIPIILLFAGCIKGDDMADYHITNVVELQAITPGHLADDCILDNDIDASATAGWPGGFLPVGSDFVPANRFTGSFDGQGHTIRNLYINRPATDDIGLFGVVDTAKEIKNVTLENCDITGRYAVGCLIGNVWTTRPEVLNITISGDLTAYAEVGGLIGTATSVNGIRVYNCHTNITITTSGDGNHVDIAGLIGDCVGDNYNIDRCSAIVNIVIGDATALATSDIGWIGGLLSAVGSDCVISNSFARGTIVAGNANDDFWDIGGFMASVGLNADVSNCYAQVDIELGNAGGDLGLMGGFCGAANGVFSNCYSTGSITYGTVGGGVTWIGGFAGNNGGIISDCFWDTESSGLAVSDGGTGHTTAQMNTQSTFTDAGWDFDAVWSICDPPQPSYPWLQWENIQCLGVIISLIG